LFGVESALTTRARELREKIVGRRSAWRFYAATIAFKIGPFRMRRNP
jgi:hypothetical protein